MITTNTLCYPYIFVLNNFKKLMKTSLICWCPAFLCKNDCHLFLQSFIWFQFQCCQYKAHTPSIETDQEKRIYKILEGYKNVILVDPPQVAFPEKLIRLVKSPRAGKHSFGRTSYFVGMKREICPIIASETSVVLIKRVREPWYTCLSFETLYLKTAFKVYEIQNTTLRTRETHALVIETQSKLVNGSNFKCPFPRLLSGIKELTVGSMIFFKIFY